MTPLEQKAREYTKSQCVYNVNCNLNESCVGCQWFDNHITQAQMQNSYNGFIAGYTEALRWRDVETDTPKEPYEVLVRSTKGNHAIATYTNLTGWILKPSIKGFGSVIAWRPIELITE